MNLFPAFARVFREPPDVDLIYGHRVYVDRQSLYRALVISPFRIMEARDHPDLVGENGRIRSIERRLAVLERQNRFVLGIPRVTLRCILANNATSKALRPSPIFFSPSLGCFGLLFRETAGGIGLHSMISGAGLNLKFLYELAASYDRNFKFTALVC